MCEETTRREETTSMKGQARATHFNFSFNFSFLFHVKCRTSNVKCPMSNVTCQPSTATSTLLWLGSAFLLVARFGPLLLWFCVVFLLLGLPSWCLVRAFLLEMGVGFLFRGWRSCMASRLLFSLGVLVFLLGGGLGVLSAVEVGPSWCGTGTLILGVWSIRLSVNVLVSVSVSMCLSAA